MTSSVFQFFREFQQNDYGVQLENYQTLRGKYWTKSSLTLDLTMVS